MYAGRVRRQGVGAHQRRHPRRRRTPSAAACSSSAATTPSTRPTTSSPTASRRRCGRTSSAAPWADRCAATGRSSSSAARRCGCNRSLTRTFSVPTLAARSGDFARLRADLRSADDPGHRRLHAVRRQPDSGRPHRSDRRRAAGARAAADLGGDAAEPDVGRGTGPRPRSVQRPPRSAARQRRSAAGPLQHLRRRRDPAVRHQRAAGVAGPGLRPLADDHDPQRRRQLHARVRQLAAQRAARRLDVGRQAARSARTAATRSPRRSGCSA